MSKKQFRNSNIFARGTSDAPAKALPVTAGKTLKIFTGITGKKPTRQKFYRQLPVKIASLPLTGKILPPVKSFTGNRR
ncbi:hypothetical protein B9Z55_012927 [Caenorhabditis nigoni]|uniref:Uncharacterized protein n=1 Tax=Caenorhabditis nigoni TaxID=1611254 RepID=A0A2G5TZM9_9PELO|nr:hypothetical protein B9Z55_012927 [Caenorhabditis nigoni]